MKKTITAKLLTGNFFGNNDTADIDTDATIRAYQQACEHRIGDDVTVEWDVQNAEGYGGPDRAYTDGEEDEDLLNQWEEICQHEYTQVAWIFKSEPAATHA